MNYPYSNYGQQQYYPQSYAQAQMTAQMQSAPQTSSIGFSCKPVTSREEAIGMLTNFTSAGDIMPDLGHGVIYLKRFNANTGTSEFAEFKYAPPETPQKPQEYATVQMLNDALDELRNDIAALNKPAKKKGSADE